MRNNDLFNMRRLSRRNFLKTTGVGAAGMIAGLAGLELIDKFGGKPLPAKLVGGATREISLGFSDGFVHMPGDPIPPFFPDPAAPSPFTTYVMGIRDLTGLTDVQQFAQKGKGQISGPVLYMDENDDFRIRLRNLGLARRPDLVDSHTFHFHGFPNQIVYFDGVPDNSLSVPIGRELIYRFIPLDPGTYMYHCHVEDVEHVHMGLSGVIFVRAAQSKTGNAAGAPVARIFGGPANAPMGYAFNDGVAVSDPRSTAYDREYAFILTEIDNHAHFNDAHLQDTDWSDFRASFRLMNGRAYPDTLAPHGMLLDADGNLLPPAGRPDLQYNPISSLIQVNAGEKLLLRFSNLGFEHHSMVLSGIPMKLIGQDAKPLNAGRPDYGIDGPIAGSRGDATSVTYRSDLGPGESRDLLITAPAYSGANGSNGYDTYPLFDRNLGFTDGAGAVGQMRTEVRVYGAGVLPPQARPHDLPAGQWR